MKLLSKFVKDEKGLETVEWAVLSALIVGGLIAAITGLAGAIEGRFTNLSNTVSGIK